MKIMKSLQLLMIIIVGFAALACIQQAGASNGVSNNTFVAKLNKINPETKSTPPELKIQEVNNSDDEPVIFNYVFNSDYVVVAISDKKDYVGKVIRQEKPDLRDSVAGFVYSFRIEKILCSSESFLGKEDSQETLLQNFQIFVRAGNQGENYKDGQRYLLFIQHIPKDEKLSETFELDKDKIYFRPFEGKISIFPSIEGSMHSPPLKGIIEMSNVKQQNLIERIETFCLALNGEDKKTKIVNLQKLTKSNDSELKNNAVYAIKVLRNN